MGASKGALLGGVALIVGIYATGIHKADAIIAGSAGTHINLLQSEANARTAVRLALNDMRDNTSWSVSRKEVYFRRDLIYRPWIKDTLWYDVDNTQNTPIKKATINAGSKYKGIETEITAYVEQSGSIVNRRGRRIGYDWTITSTFMKQFTDSTITQ